MTIRTERGIVIPAFNTDSVNYTSLAYRLAASIHQFDFNLDVAVLTNEDLPEDAPGGFANDYLVYHLSPFRQTIKLEADTIVCGSIQHWFDQMQHRDICISTGCRDIYNQPATSRFYRKLFDENNLPDVYNAITYWRISQTAKEFFKLVKNIFLNWAEFKKLLRYPDELPTTDVVYAIAAVIIGPEKCTMPFASYPKIVHMKKHIIPLIGSDWTKELIDEVSPLRIQTFAQSGAVHYHNKQWQQI